MSRTDKDRPYNVIVHDKAAYPETPRSVYHRHDLFGRPRGRNRIQKDERGTLLFTLEEVERAVLDFSGQYPRYRYETRLVKRYVYETIIVGHFADYCTAHIAPHNLPEGVFAPCRAHLGQVRQGASRTRSEAREWHGGDRRHVRDTLRGYVTEYRANGDLEDEDDLETRHRHGASWWA